MHYAFFNAVLEHLQRLFRVEDNFNLPPMENCFLNLARNLLLNSHREYLEGGEVREDLEGGEVREDLEGGEVREDLEGGEVREYLEGGEVREDLEGKYRYKENSCDERCSRRP